MSEPCLYHCEWCKNLWFPKTESEVEVLMQSTLDCRCTICAYFRKSIIDRDDERKSMSQAQRLLAKKIRELSKMKE